FGMKAEQAQQRYKLTLLPAPAGDKWYNYVQIEPREQADKADFTRARLVLSSSTSLPRQLWVEQPNGNAGTWDFENLFTGVVLPAGEFEQPVAPPGWQIVSGDVPGAQQPAARVIRQQQ